MDEILFILDRNFPVTRGAFLFFLLSLSVSLSNGGVSEGKRARQSARTVAFVPFLRESERSFQSNALVLYY